MGKRNMFDELKQGLQEMKELQGYEMNNKTKTIATVATIITIAAIILTTPPALADKSCTVKTDVNGFQIKEGKCALFQGATGARGVAGVDGVDGANGVVDYGFVDDYMDDYYDFTKAAAANSIATAYAIRQGDNGFRLGVGYYGDEAALSFGGRRGTKTFTVTFDTNDIVSLGFGVDL